MSSGGISSPTAACATARSRRAISKRIRACWTGTRAAVVVTGDCGRWCWLSCIPPAINSRAPAFHHPTQLRKIQAVVGLLHGQWLLGCAPELIAGGMHESQHQRPQSPVTTTAARVSVQQARIRLEIALRERAVAQA